MIRVYNVKIIVQSDVFKLLLSNQQSDSLFPVVTAGDKLQIF